MTMEDERSVGHVTKVEQDLGDSRNEYGVAGERNARGARLLHERHLTNVKRVRFHRRVDEIPRLYAAFFDDDVGI